MQPGLKKSLLKNLEMPGDFAELTVAEAVAVTWDPGILSTEDFLVCSQEGYLNNNGMEDSPEQEQGQVQEQKQGQEQEQEQVGDGMNFQGISDVARIEKFIAEKPGNTRDSVQPIVAVALAVSWDPEIL